MLMGFDELDLLQGRLMAASRTVREYKYMALVARIDQHQ